MTLVHKIRHLFTVKAVIVPIAGVLFFVWAVVKAKGLGPIVHQPGTLHGSAKGWAFVTGKQNNCGPGNFSDQSRNYVLSVQLCDLNRKQP